MQQKGISMMLVQHSPGSQYISARIYSWTDLDLFHQLQEVGVKVADLPHAHALGVRPFEVGTSANQTRSRSRHDLRQRHGRVYAWMSVARSGATQEPRRWVEFSHDGKPASCAW